MPGMQIFSSVKEALKAGYEVIHPCTPDSEGFARARTMTSRGWALALVRVNA